MTGRTHLELNIRLEPVRAWFTSIVANPVFLVIGADGRQPQRAGRSCGLQAMWVCAVALLCCPQRAARHVGAAGGPATPSCRPGSPCWSAAAGEGSTGWQTGIGMYGTPGLARQNLRARNALLDALCQESGAVLQAP